ncbi:MAG TPA: glycosyltransferase family 87 protein [Pseudolabrys sp.]|nr:glycosyltransferase family 87 protein [Pseudolabrys sp.]
MAGFVQHLRDGAWVTPERTRLVALALLAPALIAIAWLIGSSDGLNDALNRPLGTDFASFYAAGTLVRDGLAAAAYNPAAHFAREQAIFGAATQYYAFQYPPVFLLVSAALAQLPYLPALVLWQAATLVLYVLAIRAIVSAGDRAPVQGVSKNLWLLLALAYPAVFINLGHGQNGFLTAALFAGALALLDRRPVAAGILIGLMIYKPQFGMMIPLVLVVTARWRVVAAAALTVAAIVAISLLVTGVDSWRAFIASTAFTRETLLEQGDVGFFKMQSVFAWVGMWGGPVALAYVVQGAVTLATAAALAILWRSKARYPLKAAALLIGTLLATPFSLDYDLMLVAPAIAFLAIDAAQRGAAPKNVPWEKTLLAALWIVPLIARTFPMFTHIPLGAPVMLLSFIWLLFRAFRVDADIIESQAA